LTTHALQAGPARIRPGRLFIVGMLLTGGGLAVSVPMMLAGGSGSGGTSETTPAPATAPAPESEGSGTTIIPVGEVIPSVASSVAGGLSADARTLQAVAGQKAAAGAQPDAAGAGSDPASLLPAGLGSILPNPPVGTSGAGGGLPLVGGLPVVLMPIVEGLTGGGLPTVPDLLGGGSSDSPLGGVGGLPLMGDVLPTAGALPIPAVDGLLGDDLLSGGVPLVGDVPGGGLLGGDGGDAGDGSGAGGLPIDGLLGGLLG
jgi:hypothetical protein